MNDFLEIFLKEIPQILYEPIAVAGLLLLVAAAMLGFLVLEDYPWITALCLAYVLFSTTGGSVLAIVCTRKGGLTL